jgi:ADP-dependent NAD(P)H-hydrate dehydratase
MGAAILVRVGAREAKSHSNILGNLNVDVTTLPAWPARPRDANKGTFGRVLIIAGSRGMSGAAVLAGKACLRGGAGLVKIACPAETQPIIAASEPCVMTMSLPQTDDGHFADDAFSEWIRLAEASDVVALGPGLGRARSLDAMVPEFVACRPRPMVLDADGLNAMIGRDEAWRKSRTPIVITPHPGEFGRLVGLPTAEVQKRRRELSVDFAKRTGAIVVLKGAGTIVTDGERVFANDTGNPGMATGGTGDVLTGLTAALLAQRFAPFDAAVLAVNRHGRAGDLAGDTIGEVSLIATDLIEFLPKAIREVASSASV